jgi:hypothetical protein
MSAFRYPNKKSNIITIKIAPTIPNIQKPSRTVNCSTVFLLPLDGQWLCMGMRGPKIQESDLEQSCHVGGLLLQVIYWGAVIFTPTVTNKPAGL